MKMSIFSTAFSLLAVLDAVVFVFVDGCASCTVSAWAIFIISHITQDFFLS